MGCRQAVALHKGRSGGRHFCGKSASLPGGKAPPLWGRLSYPSEFTSETQCPLPSVPLNADEENLTAHEQHALPICNSRFKTYFKTVPVQTAWRCTGQIRLQNGNECHKGFIHLDYSLLPCLDLEFKSPVLPARPELRLDRGVIFGYYINVIHFVGYFWYRHRHNLYLITWSAVSVL